MKRTVWIEILAVLGILAAAAYFVLLILSRFVALPFEIKANVFIRDWAFLAIPVLAFLSGVLLQIAAVRKK